MTVLKVNPAWTTKQPPFLVGSSPELDDSIGVVSDNVRRADRMPRSRRASAQRPRSGRERPRFRRPAIQCPADDPGWRAGAAGRAVAGERGRPASPAREGQPNAPFVATAGDSLAAQATQFATARSNLTAARAGLHRRSRPQGHQRVRARGQIRGAERWPAGALERSVHRCARRTAQNRHPMPGFPDQPAIRPMGLERGSG